MIPLRNLKRFFAKTIRQPGYALSVFFKRIRAYLYYFFGNGRSSFPEAITLFLTHRCNLRCKMCGQWGEGGVTKKQSSQYIQEELPFESLKSIIDDIAQGKPNITLFGGEPLLYKQGIEVIRYLKTKGLHCLMITNGSLIEQTAEALVESRIDELNVSLDGNAALHDEIRGMPGLFEKIASGLKKITALKQQRHLSKPLVNLQCTVSKYNYLYLDQLLEVAAVVGADSLTFHNLIFLNQDLVDAQASFDKSLGNSSYDWSGFIFEPGIDPEVLYEKIKKIKTGRHRFAVDFYPNFSREALIAYYRNPHFMPKGYSGACVSPWMVAYVFPDGEVRPCLNFTYSFGNVKKQSFMGAWNSQEAVRYRQMLKKHKAFPVCVRCTELYRY